MLRCVHGPRRFLRGRSSSSECRALVPFDQAPLFETADGVPDFYGILGVTPDASRGQLKQAFRQTAKRWHPDINGRKANAEQRFKSVHLAHQVLSNTELRAAYDSYLARKRDQTRALPGAPPARRAGRRRRLRNEAMKVAAAVVVLSFGFESGAISRLLVAPYAVLHDRPILPAGADELVLADAGSLARPEPAAGPLETPTEPAAREASPDPITASVPTPLSVSPEEVAATTSVSPEEDVAAADKAPTREAAATPPLPAARPAVPLPRPRPRQAPAQTAVLAPPQQLAPTVLDHAKLAQATRVFGQGHRQLAAGRVAVARQYFAQAAALGLAAAAAKLADTYEPNAFGTPGSANPDPVQATNWRKRALELDAAGARPPAAREQQSATSSPAP